LRFNVHLTHLQDHVMQTALRHAHIITSTHSNHDEVCNCAECNGAHNKFIACKLSERFNYSQRIRISSYLQHIWIVYSRSDPVQAGQRRRQGSA